MTSIIKRIGFFTVKMVRSEGRILKGRPRWRRPTASGAVKMVRSEGRILKEVVLRRDNVRLCGEDGSIRG